MRYVVVTALMALAGCAAQKQAAADAGKARCRVDIPVQVGNYVRLERCFVAAIDAAGFRGAAQQILNAKRMELAEEVDAGRLTPAQATSQFAELLYRVQQDAVANEAVNAQSQAAWGNVLSTGLGMMAQPPARQPWTATCTRMGNFTTCNGN